jgi:hypothetical protein
MIVTIIAAFKRPGGCGGLITIAYFGAASFLMELLAIFRIQIMGGYLYIVLGIIVGFFMAGLALGVFLFLRFTKLEKLPKFVIKGPNLALALFAFLAAIFPFIRGSENALLIFVALAGFSGGYGYASLADRLGNNPGLPYSFDLLGASVGNIAGLALLFGTVSEMLAIGLCCGGGLLLIATNALWGSKLG